MILTTILATIAILLILGAIIIISVGGATFILAFADVIVCAMVIVFIIKLLFKRRKK